VFERFISKFECDGETGCWNWKAAISKNGYGNFSVRHVVYYAHRIAYQLYVGPIPDGMTIDHLCRNTRCVNPAHLEVTSQRTNILRGTGPTARHARLTHCRQGHPYDLLNTHVKRDGSRSCRECNRLRTPYKTAWRANKKAMVS
jgi:hypothetical protein